MTLELAVQIATVISLLLTTAALVFGIWSFYRQMNCQIYLKYTGRYEKIIGSLPAGALESRLRLGETLPQRSEALSICILKYLNLCSEEFFLYRNGFLSKKIWWVWEPEIKRMLSSPLLRQEWHRLRAEFRSYPEFFAFVERFQTPVPSQTGMNMPRATPMTDGAHGH
jgi:hypothetical protein